MPSPRAASSSSADLPPGAVVGGHRVERVIGHGSRATVYEATQLSLDRRVALKVLHDAGLGARVQRLVWPEHPGAVRLFGSGVSEHGPWLAMQLVTAGTLVRRRASLDQVAAALAQAHAQGIVHGDVSARNVLLDGRRAVLSDFGLGAAEARAEDDDVALATLVRDHAPRGRGRGPLRSRRAVLVALATSVTAAGGAVTVVLARRAADAPPPAPGTRPLGSTLAPGPLRSVDCTGLAPSGASRACTISQRDLAGRPVTVTADGTITSWAVRGARGTLALQVLRGRGARLLEIDRSADETVPSTRLHLAKADLAVAVGDRVGLVVTPGAAVGISERGARATIDRWFGPLLGPARLPERPPGSGLDHELLLRVDISPQTGPVTVAPLSGARAAAARRGRRRGSRTIAVGGGEVRTVTVVALVGAVAVDLFDGTRRVARAPVRGADGRGRVVALTGAPGQIRVRWRNPDGTLVDRTLAVTAAGLR
jgi:hypothetical protein